MTPESPPEKETPSNATSRAGQSEVSGESITQSAAGRNHDTIKSIPVTSVEAQKYAEALVHLSAIWYAGKKHNRHLLQKHLGQYNAIRELIRKLNDAVHLDHGPIESGSRFDVELSRENEAEAHELS